jgi:hydrophobe/amphiphile efflux-3 (HAE3) family protein
MRHLFARIAGWCVERPAPVLAATVLLALVGAVGALKLEAAAGTDQLVDEGSEAFVATEEYKEEFGDDAVAVLVEGDLEQLVLTEDLGTLTALEACLSGNAPEGKVFPDKPAPEPCAELAETKPARVVYGPGTFLNQFVIQAQKLLGEQAQAVERNSQIAAAKAVRRARRQGLPEAEQVAAAEAAATEVIQRFEQQLLTLATRYGQTGLPSLDDPAFVSQVVFDSREQGQPKAKFSYLFPSAEAALISIRLRPELGEAERSEAIQRIRAAVADPTFRLRETEYVVAGVPVVIDDLAGTLSGEIFLLLGIALVVMAIVLALLVGPPLRLLPLAIALGAAALTFGLLAALGGSLTLASLAVLPVLIGLAVDYAIQFQARFGELRRSGDSAPRAAVAAAAASGPVIATAALATMAGFLVLLLWPIPVIRSFGLLLLAGVALAYVLSVTAGLTVLSLTKAPRARRGRSFPGADALARIADAWRRAGARVRSSGKRAVAFSVANSGRLLAVAVAIALAGWVGGTQTDVNADIRSLLPSDLQALEDVDELERGTGVSGEVDVAVRAEDFTDPAVITWMRDYKERVLERAGFSAEPETCLDQDAQLCPSIALPDLFGGEEPPSQEQVARLLELLPPYFSQAVVSTDLESGEIGNTASIAFGIKVMPFGEQKRLVDAIRAEIDPPGSENDPPPGVSAEVVGLPVLVADASASLTRDRYLLTLGGLAAVALVLLLVYRSARRALVPLVPIVLATGWSACAIWLLGIDLNPMSATLGALVIAIATEFSVLLAARFEEERARGLALGDALRSVYATTGTAVVASGVSLTAGFAVLAVSEIPMLREFGLATVLDLSVALIGVLIVLPATLVWAEGGFAPAGALAARLRTRRGRPSTAPS